MSLNKPNYNMLGKDIHDLIDGHTAQLADIMSQSVSVLKYKDQISNGDWTQAFQSAHDEAGVNGVVFYPYSQSYLISDVIKVYTGQTVFSMGSGTVSISQTADKPFFASKNYYSGGSPTGKTIIEGFTLNGISSNPNNHGILLRDYYSTIRDVRVMNVGGDAFHLTHLDVNGNAVSGTLVENKIKDSWAINPTGYCYYLGDTDNNKITDGFLIDCLASSTTSTKGHLFVGSSAGWDLDGLHCYGEPIDNPIIIQNNYFDKLDNIYIESFKVNALKIQSIQKSLQLGKIAVKCDNANPGTDAIYMSISGAVSECNVNIDNLILDLNTNVSINGINTTSANILVRVGNYATTGSYKSQITKFVSTGANNIKRISDAIVDGTLRETVAKTTLTYQGVGLAQFATSQKVSGTAAKTVTLPLSVINDYQKIIGTIHFHSNSYDNGSKIGAWMAQFYVSAKVNGTDAWKVQSTDIITPTGFTVNPTLTVTRNADNTGTLTISFTLSSADSTGVFGLVYAPSSMA